MVEPEPGTNGRVRSLLLPLADRPNRLVQAYLAGKASQLGEGREHRLTPLGSSFIMKISGLRRFDPVTEIDLAGVRASERAGANQ